MNAHPLIWKLIAIKSNRVRVKGLAEVVVGQPVQVFSNERRLGIDDTSVGRKADRAVVGDGGIDLEFPEFPELHWLDEAVRSVDRSLVSGSTVQSIGVYERWVQLRLKAMLLLGFWAGLNCAQLSSLKIVRMPQVWDELEVRLNDEPVSCPRLLRLCPFQAVQAWMDETGVTMGPLFRRIGRQRGGGVCLLHLEVHPAAICSMLDSAWNGAGGAFELGKRASAKQWTHPHGWQCVDRHRLVALTEFVGVDVSEMER